MNCMKLVASALTAVLLATSASAGTQPEYLFRAKPVVIGAEGYVPPPTGPDTPTDPGNPTTPVETPFAISAAPAGPVSVIVGSTASVVITASGAKGAVSYALVDPAAALGAQIDVSTGILVLSPTAPGAFEALVRATDQETAKTADLKIPVAVDAVAGKDPDIVDVPAEFAAGKVGDPVTFTPTVRTKGSSEVWPENGTFSINTDLSPYGLAFDATSGKISGVVSDGAYLQNVVITVTSDLGRSDSTAPFTLILTPDKDMEFAAGVTGIVKTTPSTPTTKSLSVLNALGPVKYSITQKSAGLSAVINIADHSYTLSSAGGEHSMTVHAVDAVGRTADKDIAVSVGTFYDLDFIAIAKYNSCGLSIEGGLYCWGTQNPASKTKVPALVSGFESGVTTIAVGIKNVCAIKNGALYCVGGNAFGQIGDNTTVDKTVFTPVSGMSSGVTDVAVVGEVTGTGSDTFHACAVKDGSVYCWGSNSAKQIANTSTTTYKVPTLVAGVPGTATKVAVGATAGSAFSCAVSSGQLYCWGSNDQGQLGLGDSTARTTPTLVSALGSTVTDIDTSMQFACAVSDGKAYCWGSNTQGQLGDGTKTRRFSPVPVNMASASRVDVGQYGACAETGSLWSCWGAGVTAPTVVQVPYVLRYVSVGYLNTCALSEDGGYCWGTNDFYVFGDGTDIGSDTPKSIPYY